MKKIIIGIIFILSGFTHIYAQDSVANPDNSKVFYIVQTMPKFSENPDDWFKKNMSYHGQSKGEVMVSFVVEKDGSLSGVKILKGVPGPDGDAMEREAKRLVKSMPNWKPGENGGNIVRVGMNEKIEFAPGEITIQPAENNSSDKLFTIVEQQPKFPGEINKWLVENIVYPVQAKNNNIQGKVYVSFVVEKDGSVSGVKVLRGADRDLDNEAVRVVSMMPNWTPGMQNGKPVRVQYTVPINFTLGDIRATPPPPNENTANNTGMQTATDPSGQSIQVDQKPEFHGNLLSYLAANVHYPAQCKEKKIEGSIYTSFVVGKDGYISDIRIEKSTNGGEEFNRESIRVINAMPKWKPALQNGKPVAVRLFITIPFFINVDEE